MPKQPQDAEEEKELTEAFLDEIMTSNQNIGLPEGDLNKPELLEKAERSLKEFLDLKTDINSKLKKVLLMLR